MTGATDQITQSQKPPANAQTRSEVPVVWSLFIRPYLARNPRGGGGGGRGQIMRLAEVSELRERAAGPTSGGRQRRGGPTRGHHDSTGPQTPQSALKNSRLGQRSQPDGGVWNLRDRSALRTAARRTVPYTNRNAYTHVCYTQCCNHGKRTMYSTRVLEY